MRKLILALLIIATALACKKEDPIDQGKLSDIAILSGEIPVTHPDIVKHRDFTLVGIYSDPANRIWKLKHGNYILIIDKLSEKNFRQYKVNDYVHSDFIFTLMGWNWRG